MYYFLGQIPALCSINSVRQVQWRVLSLTADLIFPTGTAGFVVATSLRPAVQVSTAEKER